MPPWCIQVKCNTVHNDLPHSNRSDAPNSNQYPTHDITYPWAPVVINKAKPPNAKGVGGQAFGGIIGGGVDYSAWAVTLTQPDTWGRGRGVGLTRRIRLTVSRAETMLNTSFQHSCIMAGLVFRRWSYRWRLQNSSRSHHGRDCNSQKYQRIIWTTALALLWSVYKEQ